MAAPVRRPSRTSSLSRWSCSKNIAELAESEDLLNIGLVNREAKDKVQLTFIATHFRKKMFLISFQETLETLLAIAGHPEFGKAMQTVLLCNEISPDAEHIQVRNGGCVSRWNTSGRNQATTRIIEELQGREWRRLTKEQA